MAVARAYLRVRSRAARDLTWERPLEQILQQRLYFCRPPRGAGRADTHKGWEARLVLATAAELESAQEALREAGFRLGRAFVKRSGWVLPVYGKAAVARLRQLQRDSRAQKPVERRGAYAAVVSGRRCDVTDGPAPPGKAPT